MRALKISDEIVCALNSDRILIALQPIVEAATGQPAMYEALMRLRRSDGSLAAPAAVLPTAEKSGLIQMIDQRVLELALKKLMEQPDMNIAVNMSGQTLHEPDFLARFRALIGGRPELARRLTVEITETCAIEDVEATGRAIAGLKQFGAQGGDGRFRLRPHLVQEPAPARRRPGLKIDGAFVQNLRRSVDDRFFVRTLIDLARHIGIPTVAEWVEDAETAAMLREWGIEFLQGYSRRPGRAGGHGRQGRRGEKPVFALAPLDDRGTARFLREPGGERLTPFWRVKSSLPGRRPS